MIDLAKVNWKRVGEGIITSLIDNEVIWEIIENVVMDQGLDSEDTDTDILEEEIEKRIIAAFKK